MPLRHASLALLLLLFALSLITFIASVKYAAWAAVSIEAAGSAIPIIFYSGTVPLLSFIQTTLQVACLHLLPFLPPAFFLVLAVTGSLAWLVQASIWTTCEVSGGLPAPGKAITTPHWCPQFSFQNHGGNLSGPLTIFKITLAWAMLTAYLALVITTCLSVQQVSAGKRVDDFYELTELAPLTPSATKVRPYSTTFELTRAEKAPAIQVLPAVRRP